MEEELDGELVLLGELHEDNLPILLQCLVDLLSHPIQVGVIDKLPGDEVDLGLGLHDFMGLGLDSVQAHVEDGHELGEAQPAPVEVELVADLLGELLRGDILLPVTGVEHINELQIDELGDNLNAVPLGEPGLRKKIFRMGANSCLGWEL